jgi:hypothetical protein
MRFGFGVASTTVGLHHRQFGNESCKSEGSSCCCEPLIRTHDPDLRQRAVLNPSRARNVSPKAASNVMQMTDAERMDNLCRRSCLFRPKWDDKHFADGDTYGVHTVRTAIENSTATYGGDSFKALRPTHGGASVCIADVQSHPVEWLWRGWIPRGKLTLLEGDPGVAKSLLTIELAARITKGLPMPDGSPCERGSVVIVNAEDGLEDTVKPRLEVAGADIPRCHWLNFSLEDGQQTLIIPSQMDALKEKIEESKAVLVIIDPLVAYLEKRINSWNDQDVGRAMAALSQLARQTGAAIVLIRHLNKKEDVKNKIYRGAAQLPSSRRFGPVYL